MPSPRPFVAVFGMMLLAGVCLAADGAYSDLLADPALAASIVWEGPTGPVAYPAWTAGQKQNLARALQLADAGLPAGLKGPPEPILPLKLKGEGPDLSKLGAEESQATCEDDGHVFYAADDAWKMYVAHVAHSLWLERGRKVAWSLESVSVVEELNSY